MAKRIPVVALVGRPNVGKSTLFNRLAGERLAVVDDTPGTTRDRLHSHADWGGVDFIIVDTGGIDPTEVKIGTGREPLSCAATRKKSMGNCFPRFCWSSINVITPPGESNRMSFIPGGWVKFTRSLPNTDREPAICSMPW